MIDYANQFHVIDANNALSNLARQILKGVSVGHVGRVKHHQSDDTLDIVQEAESAKVTHQARHFKLRRSHTATVDGLLASACRYANMWVQKGYRVALVSDGGLRRAGAVVYCLLRLEHCLGVSVASAKTPRWQVLRRMHEMNSRVHDAFQDAFQQTGRPQKQPQFAAEPERLMALGEFKRALDV